MKIKQVRLNQYVKARISSLIYPEKLSPELIVKRLSKEGLCFVSYESILKLFWDEKHNILRSNKSVLLTKTD